MRPRAAFVLVALFCAGMPTLAAAQGNSPSGRSFRSVFGPTEQDEIRPPALTFSLSVYSGLDDNSRFATGSVQDDALQTGRAHQGVLGAFRIVRRRARTLFTADLASAVRYYPTLRGIGTQKHSGSATLAVTVSRNMRVLFGQTASFSPSYQLALGRTLPLGTSTTVAPDAGVDYSVSREKQISYGSSAEVNYAGLAGGELGVGQTLRVVDFFTRPDFLAERTQVSYTRPIARGIGVRLGYGIASGGLRGDERRWHHDLDIGIDYNRSVLFSPRATLAFTTGAAIVNTPSGRQVPLIGSIQLQNRWSPRWTSGLAYQRGVQSIESVSEPFIAGTLSGTLHGYVSNAVRLTFAPSYARGAMVGVTSAGYQSWTNESRMDVALSHHWAIYAEHFFYHYRFDASARLPDFLASGLRRHGLRGGIALWAPVIR